jgi:hypothetical protein
VQESIELGFGGGLWHQIWKILRKLLLFNPIKKLCV